MTTITSNTNFGITLSSAIVVNPGVTVSNAEAGIYGATGATGGPWTIQNDGTVSSTNFYGIGLVAGGSVTNAASAAIVGYSDGVAMLSGVGTVLNSGRISGTGTSADGVYLKAGGSVTNAASASISGGSGGVSILAGTVVNSGTIVGNSGRISGTGGNAGGVLLAQGSVTNAVPGTISGGSDGVYLGAGMVLNSGTIVGTRYAGVYLHDSGSVTNAVSGSIMGAVGVFALHTSGTLVNFGAITGSAGDGEGVGLYSGGLVSNGASATITGGLRGIAFFSGTGTVLNSGTIVATGVNGIYLNAGGSVTNSLSGSISGGSDGVFGSSGAECQVRPSKTSRKLAASSSSLSSAGCPFDPENWAMMTSTGSAQRVGRAANHFRKLQELSGERICLAPDHANRSRGLWIPKASDGHRRRACLHRRGHFRDQGYTHPGANHLDKRR
jgi:hypothetical protein